MSWLVVLFEKENSVEAVPKRWFIEKSEECFWPPKGYSTNKILNSIKSKESPDENWKPHPAKILGVYDDYKTAQKKASKAQDTNCLSSNAEDIQDPIGKGKRLKVKNKKYETSTDTSIESNSDDNIYPVTPRMLIDNNLHEDDAVVIGDQDAVHRTSHRTSNTVHKTLNPIHKTSIPFHRISNTNNVSNALSNLLGTLSDDGHSNVPSESSERSHTTTSILDVAKTSADELFRKHVIHDLSIIIAKLNFISETVTSMQRNDNVEMVDNDEIPNIIRNFPVDEPGLNRLEKWLGEKPENSVRLSKELCRIGGNTVKDLTRKIMYRIFSNEVGMQYSWDGAKKKKKFKDLAVAFVILRAVRLNKNTANVTEAEIINNIRLWLVRCKDRQINQETRRKRADTAGNDEAGENGEADGNGEVAAESVI